MAMPVDISKPSHHQALRVVQFSDCHVSGDPAALYRDADARRSFTDSLSLIAADTVARAAVAQNELPVGVVTALIGGPFFLALFLRQIRRGAV